MLFGFAGLFVQSGDPLFLAVGGIVSIGVAITGISLWMDAGRRSARPGLFRIGDRRRRLRGIQIALCPRHCSDTIESLPGLRAPASPNGPGRSSAVAAPPPQKWQKNKKKKMRS